MDKRDLEKDLKILNEWKVFPAGELKKIAEHAIQRALEAEKQIQRLLDTNDQIRELYRLKEKDLDTLVGKCTIYEEALKLIYEKGIDKYCIVTAKEALAGESK